MKIALVAMPWTFVDMPSPATGILSAFIHQERPGDQVDCHFPYLDLAGVMGLPQYRAIASDDRLGEMLFSVQLYPEKRESLRGYFVRWCETRIANGVGPESDLGPDKLFDFILESTEALTHNLADKWAKEYDIVGFTTSYCQLFPSLTVAHRLKSQVPDMKIIFGGMGVSWNIGHSVIEEFPYVDYVVQGEGEARLVNLISAIEAGHEPSGSGILCQQESNSLGENEASAVQFAALAEVSDLNQLPTPDYDEYASAAKKHSISWTITLEGSRGCWWDRVKKTKNPMNSCYFCSLNTSSYRHKSIEKIATEMAFLSDRYGNTRMKFLDNIIRNKGIPALAEAIQSQEKDYDFFYELRANIHPYDILQLWEAGCTSVQIGLEGLSSTYLKRIGKGTSAIQNLQAMKICFELDIESGSNLIVDYPGTTQAEIEETVTNILNYAIIYQPAHLVPFTLYLGSAISALPDHFKIGNIRNSEDFLNALPKSVWERLVLYWRDFDFLEEQTSWQPVHDAAEKWRALHRERVGKGFSKGLYPYKPLWYRDGGTFLELFDLRDAHFQQYRFNPFMRDVYMFCMEIRTLSSLHREFAGTHGAERLNKVLKTLVDKKFMFAEKGKYLSLAVAPRPQIAARRITRAFERKTVSDSTLQSHSA